MDAAGAASSDCLGCHNGDTRVAVPDELSATFPYSAAGELESEFSDSWCSGALVSPRHVLTAAHCLWDIDVSLRFVKGLNFSAGRSPAAAPFGFVGAVQTRVLPSFTKEPWYDEPASEVDFGLITLAQPVGRAAGWLGLQSATLTDSVAANLTTNGYPGDKPANSMWTTSCVNTIFNATAGIGSARVKHDCASTKGQSGASMYDSNYRVRAIITAGTNSQNYAIQVDDFVFSTLLQWMRQDGEFPVDKRASAESPASAGAGDGGKATELAAFAGASLPQSLAETFLPAFQPADAAAGGTGYSSLRVAAGERSVRR